MIMSYAIENVPANKNGYHTPAEAKAYYGRYSREGITLHWWGGNEEENAHDGIVQYFVKQSQQGVKSVNFVVSDAKITQMVAPDDVAWCSQSGNPTTISIECEPNLSDEGYKRLGWLIKQMELKYGHRMNLYRHSHWASTACPGRIDENRARREADGAEGGSVATPAPSAPAPATPAPSANTLYLPPVDSWAVYRVGSQNRRNTEDQVGTLRPGPVSNGQGLTYDLLENHGNYGVIQTRDFGRVQIWIAPGTGAIVGSAGAPSPAPAPAPASSGNRTLHLPPVDSWRVYPLDKNPSVGNEKGFLRPGPVSQGKGLDYAILGNPYPNVYTIQTRDFGTVNIWAAPDTQATIS